MTIELPKSLLEAIIARLNSISSAVSSPTKKFYYEQLAKKSLDAGNHDHAVYWAKKAAGVGNEEDIKGAVISKLQEASTAPITLSSKELSFLKHNRVQDVPLSYNMVCKHSSISNIGHKNRFYGFPLLKAQIDAKINKLRTILNTLCSSSSTVTIIVKD